MSQGTDKSQAPEASFAVGSGEGGAPIPSGSSSWFVCHTSRIADDILLPIKDGATANDETLAEKGRTIAARAFKDRYGLHPCTKVEVEFQGVEKADGTMLEPRP